MLGDCAASVLMYVLYGARLARWGLLRAVGMLTTRISKWTSVCDQALHMVMSYTACTADVVLVGSIGDSLCRSRGPRVTENLL